MRAIARNALLVLSSFAAPVLTACTERGFAELEAARALANGKIDWNEAARHQFGSPLEIETRFEAQRWHLRRAIEIGSSVNRLFRICPSSWPPFGSPSNEPKTTPIPRPALDQESGKRALLGDTERVDLSRSETQNQAPTRLRKTVISNTSESLVQFDVAVDLEREGTFQVELEIRNLGESPVYVMTKREWRVAVDRDQHVVTAILGHHADSSYGSALPKLQRLAQGDSARERATLEVEGGWKGITFLTVDFFAISTKGSELEAKLRPLPADRDWWWTGDLQLADEFYRALVNESVSFGISPLGLVASTRTPR